MVNQGGQAQMGRMEYDNIDMNQSPERDIVNGRLS